MLLAVSHVIRVKILSSRYWSGVARGLRTQIEKLLLRKPREILSQATARVTRFGSETP